MGQEPSAQESLVVATFGPTTAWVGKTITLHGGQFVLEDHGPIAAADVLAYHQQGHLVWASTAACMNGYAKWRQSRLARRQQSLRPPQPSTTTRSSSSTPKPPISPAERSSLALYLGWLDGEAVASSLLVPGAGVAGIYCVATLPAARRRGIGSALALRALLEGRARGYRAGVLAAEEAGVGLYRRLGLQEYCKIGCYLWEP